MKIASRLVLALAAPVMACAVWTQSMAAAIYTCVDGQGRKFTSDRPIPECVDREQQLLNPSGTLKQKIAPPLTAAERAQKEARDKQELEARNRAQEERRRDKALLTRFPNRAALDRHSGLRRHRPY